MTAKTTNTPIPKINIFTGRRKRSVARVILKEGTGNIIINNKKLEEYFPRGTHRLIIMQPLELTKTEKKYDISVNVFGRNFRAKFRLLTNYSHFVWLSIKVFPG